MEVVFALLTKTPLGGVFFGHGLAAEGELIVNLPLPHLRKSGLAEAFLDLGHIFLHASTGLIRTWAKTRARGGLLSWRGVSERCKAGVVYRILYTTSERNLSNCVNFSKFFAAPAPG